jgi:hypothetical protein
MPNPMVNNTDTNELQDLASVVREEFTQLSDDAFVIQLKTMLTGITTIIDGLDKIENEALEGLDSTEPQYAQGCLNTIHQVRKLLNIPPSEAAQKAIDKLHKNNASLDYNRR